MFTHTAYYFCHYFDIIILEISCYLSYNFGNLFMYFLGITPGFTRLIVMDTRLPSLNEFSQMKLKAGAYSTPIEISHVQPTNVLPTLYSTKFGNSAFQYVFL